MKSKKTILLILIILASLIPEVRAITPQSQTVKITDTHDDAFITEVGIGIDSSLVTILDPNMDIRSYLVFRELDVNYWEPLKNATLRLHTSTTLAFDADSSISVYGMALSDLQLEGWLLPSTVLSLGFTTARTDYNTSEFYGNVWHEINVTDIVEELIRDPNWDGDGIAGSETGDAIGFHIVGAEGDDKRYFYDYSVGNGFEAQLIIHWNHEPPPPSGGAPGSYEYEEEYRNHTIWYLGNIGGWLNFSTFTLIGADKMTGENDTYFQLTNMYGDTQSYYRRNFSDDGSGIYNVKFGIKWELLPWSGATQYVYVNLWGISSEHDESQDWDEGYTFSSRTYSDRANGLAWALSGGALKDSSTWAPNLMEVDLPWTHFYNITLNMNTKSHVTNVYNDFEMTDLNVTYSDTFSDGPVYADGLFIYEYLYAPEGPATDQTGITCEYLSQPDPDAGYWVAEKNGTIIAGPFDTLEDAEDFIETHDVDPQDPNPGGTWDDTGPYTRFRTRLYILLIGFGLLFGPLFYFAIRRPSGYEFVIGLFIMLIGYAFMIAAAGI